MKNLRNRRYPGPGGMIVCSFLLHVALVLIVITFRLYPEAHPIEETTYYVDMVSLPVAAPEKGTLAPAPAPPAATKPAASEPTPVPPTPAPPKAAPPPARPGMTYPTAKAKPAPSQKSRPEGAADQLAPTRDEARAFQERMAKLERQAEDRRQADVLARLRQGKGGKPGAPNGKGTESGSDYAAFIHSRLKDAFIETIAFQSKAPQVTVRLVIGADGRIAQYRIERSTGDRMFEDAVDRAVHNAEKHFRKPPGGAPFEQGFIFRPKGVGIK